MGIDPDADGSQLESGGEVVGAPVVARGKAPHLLDAIEEALDEVALAVDPSTEGEGALADRARRDVRSGIAAGDEGADAVRVISFVGDDGRSGRDGVEQLGRHRRVAGLSGRQLEAHRAPFGVDESMDLGGQAATGMSHARIGRSPFFAPAPCWWTRTQELSIMRMSPS